MNRRGGGRIELKGRIFFMSVVGFEVDFEFLIFCPCTKLINHSS